MMCDGCKKGAHCGPPGLAGPSCTCQHRPLGTGQTVCQYGCLHQVADHKPGRGCTRTGCNCLAGAQFPVPVARSVPTPDDVPPLVVTVDEVALMADAVQHLSSAAVAEAGMIAACKDTDDCCPAGTCRLDAYRAAHGSVTTVGVVPVHPGAERPSDDATQTFVSLLADWMRHHRAGRFSEAAAIRKILVGRLHGMGPLT